MTDAVLQWNLRKLPTVNRTTADPFRRQFRMQPHGDLCLVFVPRRRTGAERRCWRQEENSPDYDEGSTAWIDAVITMIQTRIPILNAGTRTPNRLLNVVKNTILAPYITKSAIVVARTTLILPLVGLNRVRPF